MRSGASAPSSRRRIVGDLAAADQRTRDLLVVQRADLLERVRERIVADVVEQRGDADEHAFVAAERREVLVLLEQRQRAPREVVRSERVLEPRVCRAGVDEEREPELADVAQPLEGRRVDQLEAERIEPDVVPERVADDFDGHPAMIPEQGPKRLDRKPVVRNNFTRAS